jgi:hypothetical protein
MTDSSDFSRIAESLQRACDDDRLAEKWKDAILQLANNQKEKLKIEGLPSKTAARLILHSLGRGYALFQNAKEWDIPLIGSRASNERLVSMRGIMWRYVMAYCGWEQCTKALGFTQKTQCVILSCRYDLNPPILSESQKKNISLWVPAFAEEEGQNIDFAMSEFLSLEGNYNQFPNWLLGQKVELHKAQILAILRNIVVHGSLSASKGLQWNLKPLYEDGFNLIDASLVNMISMLNRGLSAYT